ncbi:LLM class flavin-dependent oxidoreductase [Cytobacillus sp. FJAT-54145]|uniref:LLM class flavin-dependent oxidoreductase n=1 Tax=Cytobacillus spartinae TaxID=3299023 RepID=A0ABW6K8R1_9BACI
MDLSILDQSPIPSGQTAQAALQASMKLAQSGEKFGYTRYWIAEHHDLEGLACSAPEVMLGYIGANTNTIRLGCGAVLLPHYKPYKVAETYNMLATLFPNRIDIGIGRAPGGSAEATMALSDNFLDGVRKMPEKVNELIQFLHSDFPNDHMFSKVKAKPLPSIVPEPWILGTSKKSALMAAEHGTSYAFGLFMSDQDGVEILDLYKTHFRKGVTKEPKTILTVSVLCGETTEKADDLAWSSYLWRLQNARGEAKGIPSIEIARTYPYTPSEKEGFKDIYKKMIIGTPKEVSSQLIDLKKKYGVDEIMIVTITHQFEDREKSYELIAREFDLISKGGF